MVQKTHFIAPPTSRNVIILYKPNYYAHHMRFICPDCNAKDRRNAAMPGIGGKLKALAFLPDRP